MQLLTNGALTRRPETKPTHALDPYAPIEKRPLITHDGMRSKGFTVRMEDDRAASGWREVGIVSDDYLLVENRTVRDMAEECAVKSGFDFQTARVLFDGKRYALAIAFPTALATEVRVGDPVSLGMLWENSYEGSRRLGVSLYVHRLACSNGLLAPHLFGRVRIKHSKASEGWEDDVRRVLSVLNHAEHGLDEFARAASKLCDMPLSPGHLKALRSGPLAGVPVTVWAKALDRTLLKEEHTIYGLLQGATASLWHDAKPAVKDLEHNETFVRALLSYGHRHG